MKEEGVIFKTGINVGQSISTEELINKFDAVVLCCGAEEPRDLQVKGKELTGIYFAMEYLTQQTRSLHNVPIHGPIINAKGKNVIILGGGDTGSDCVGTANRQGAKSVKQFELLPEPPLERTTNNPWPEWAYTKKISTSHEEGVEQDYCIMTKQFNGENGILKSLHAVKVEFSPKDPTTGKSQMKEIANSEFKVETDLVFLAMGFLGPVKKGIIEELKLDLDNRGNVITNQDKMTNMPGIFAAGDISRGQSLVVWAIHEGRQAARGVDQYLMGDTQLPYLSSKSVSIPY